MGHQIFRLQKYGPSLNASPRLDKLCRRPKNRRRCTFRNAHSERILAVETLPAGDHQLNFQIDLNSGLVVGTHAAMHSLVATDDPLGRKLFDAIATSFNKAADELADEIDRQLASTNNVKAAIEAVKREPIAVCSVCGRRNTY